MIEHARREPRLECCGLLAGRGYQITHAYPAENVAANPATSYEVSTKEIVNLTRQIRENGLELLGIYHSHPNGDNKPSARDIEQACYPDVAYFILSPRKDTAEPIRVFWIRDGKTEELKIQSE